MVPDVPALPIRLTDRYYLDDEIGSGGMARVHLGRLVGPAFSRAVAIKRLRATGADRDELRAMLTDEARLAARVRHPNVVQTLEVVSAGDELFLVMEYVDGVSLNRLLRAVERSGARMPQPVLCAVLCHVLDGLHAVHEATDERGVSLGIVHRDVSPDNVIVGADGFARVLDFGVAKARNRACETRNGEIKGKLCYMAPEQLSGKVSRQSDVFAASIVLWEGLVGRRLFQGDDDGETIGRVLATIADPPESVAPVSPELSAIVMRGLARDPRRRWATARDMAQALREQSLATPVEIGAWVEATEQAWLVARRALVQRVEATPTTAGDPAPAPAGAVAVALTIPAIARRHPMRRYVLGGAAALLAGGLFAAWLRSGEPAPAPAAVVVAAPVAAAPSAAEPVSAPRASAPSVAAAPPPSHEVAPQRARRHAIARPQTVHAPARSSEPTPSRAPSPPRCDPPYRLGPLGEKIWLKDCL